MSLARAKPQLPLAVLTGFLGSGKTTLLNRLVKQPGMRSTAVIINEFGEIGIDHLLVEASTELMVELNNGCICCTIRGDLSDKLGSLAMMLDMGSIPPVERVVVETTGLADPAPIIHTLVAEPDLLSRYRLDRVLTVVDAIAGASALDRFPEATKQVAMADLLIVAKTDLVGIHSDPKAFAGLKARLRGLNPSARIHETVHGAIDPELCLRPRDENVAAVFAELGAHAPLDASCERAEGAAPHAHHEHGAGQHDYRGAGIDSFAIEWMQPLDAERFNAFLKELAADFGPHLLRTKGILYVSGAAATPAVIHGVQHIFFPVSWLERWPTDERCSRIVFITQDLAPEIIRNRFKAHFP